MIWAGSISGGLWSSSRPEQDNTRLIEAVSSWDYFTLKAQKFV